MPLPRYRLDPKGVKTIVTIFQMLLPSIIMIAIAGVIGLFYGYNAMMASFPAMGVISFVGLIIFLLFRTLFKRVN